MKQRVTLTFSPRNVHTPITYRLAKDFNIAANIIRAQVAPNKIGKLVLELSGDMDELEAAIEWMKSCNIDVSLVSQEILINEDSCVDWGLSHRSTNSGSVHFSTPIPPFSLCRLRTMYSYLSGSSNFY